MIYEGFKIHSVEHITEAYCTNKRCKGKELIEVSNGFLSSALFCPSCESVYLLTLTRYNKKDKKSKAFIQQCRDEVRLQELKKQAIAQAIVEQQENRMKELDKKAKRKK